MVLFMFLAFSRNSPSETKFRFSLSSNLDLLGEPILGSFLDWFINWSGCQLSVGIITYYVIEHYFSYIWELDIMWNGGRRWPLSLLRHRSTRVRLRASHVCSLPLAWSPSPCRRRRPQAAGGLYIVDVGLRMCASPRDSH